MSIGAAAREAGVGIETIRFYERQGLVSQPPRPEGAGMRLYPAATVERVRFIKVTQELGFSLREVQDLLKLWADPSADCADVRDLAVAKLADVHRKIRGLQEIGVTLERLTNACPGNVGLRECPVMDALTSHAGAVTTPESSGGCPNPDGFGTASDGPWPPRPAAAASPGGSRTPDGGLGGYLLGQLMGMRRR
ncbi:MerR family transcriptional regulator [Belnapia rosea]|uniref:MerR family transcriptional regulator n=1 Tax=Belnapia rosea TaxID=938405 RepID=UPI00210B7896|nr:MerR family transcriptional regulator [Belnapia rosea]